MWIQTSLTSTLVSYKNIYIFISEDKHISSSSSSSSAAAAFDFPTLTTLPYYASLLGGLLVCIFCPQRADLSKFLLVDKHRQAHVQRSIGKHRLSVRTRFSNCAAPFFRITSMVCDVGGKWLCRCLFVGSYILDLLKTAHSFLCSSDQYLPYM